MRPRTEFKFTGKPEGAHTADSRAPRGVCLFEGGAQRIYKYITFKNIIMQLNCYLAKTQIPSLSSLSMSISPTKKAVNLFTAFLFISITLWFRRFRWWRHFNRILLHHIIRWHVLTRSRLRIRNLHKSHHRSL